MDGRYHSGSEFGLEHLSSLARNAEGRSKKRLCSGRPETDKNVRPNETQFGFKPWTTSGDVARTRFLVNAPLPTGLPFEMFNRVCDVNFAAVDPGFFQS